MRKRLLPKPPKPQSELLTIVVIGLLLAVVVDFLLWQQFYNPFILKAKFEYADGIKTGAPVYLAGVKVGSVKEIRFLQPPQNRNSREYFEIVFELENEINGHPTGEMIRKDAKATLIVSGSLGDRSVDIYPGTAAAAATSSGDYIASDVEVNISMLVDRSHDMRSNFERTLELMRQSEKHYKAGRGTAGKLARTDEFEASVRSLQQEVELLSKELEESKSLARFKRDPKNLERIENLSSLLRQLKALLERSEGSAAKFISQRQEIEQKLFTLQKRLERIFNAIDKIRKQNLSIHTSELQALRQNLGKLYQATEEQHGSLGRLIKDPRLSSNLSQILAEIDKIAYDMKQTPRKYIKFTLF
ncbi:MAG: MlaD family protein [Acidobacteriota bacterium]|nr:MlaD family protein [Blastocatellia bacterium]MDW8412587.1 MlaD family protein [Acidobacteriota bacterium]